MTTRYPAARLTEIAAVATGAPPAQTIDRGFELPPILFGITVALYLATLTVFAIGLRDPGLILPIAICVISVAMGFGVPALWARTAPAHPDRPLAWSSFRRDGIVTATGRLDASAAVVQMLILPILILAWAMICVVIAAFALAG